MSETIQETFEQRLGRIIRERRKQLGENLKQFSDRIGPARATISRIELGSSDASTTMWVLSEIAKGLGMSAWELARMAETGQ